MSNVLLNYGFGEDLYTSQIDFSASRVIFKENVTEILNFNIPINLFFGDDDVSLIALTEI